MIFTLNFFTFLYNYYMICYTWLTKYVYLNDIFKRGVSRRCTRFYIRWKYLVCVDKSHTSGWRRMSEGKMSNTKLYMQEFQMLVWKLCNVQCPFQQALSGRVLVAAYWLFIVLMLATFTANLAAFLTVERMQTTVQSLEELGRQSRINYTAGERPWHFI